jgi:bifunctional DNA-binding transcriptional regulator/antitoxin component of YhaV-PrlF toxin-antitoxin module
MTYQLKISKQNQVTLPVNLLKYLNLSAGDFIYIKADNEDFRILNTKAKIENLSGSLGSKVKDRSKLGISDEELEKAIEKSKMLAFKKNKNQK